MPATRNRTASKPSRTAEYASAIRALHVRRVTPPVFSDQLARSMCGPLWRSITQSEFLSRIVIDGLLGKMAPIGTVVIVRARYGEERAELAVRAGIGQYVIIGAGYETFAMRRGDLMKHLAVYELDQAATQVEKRRRMAQAGIAEPPDVRYIPVDLEIEDPCTALRRTDFDFSRPALCSWFGVTYYVSRAGIDKTLRTIASEMAPGSSIMFDYLADPVPPDCQDLAERCAAFVARHGEPWVSGFDPSGLADYLRKSGFSDLHHLKPTDVGPQYFATRRDLTYPAMIGMCHAATSRAAG